MPYIDGTLTYKTLKPNGRNVKHNYWVLIFGDVLGLGVVITQVHTIFFFCKGSDSELIIPVGDGMSG